MKELLGLLLILFAIVDFVSAMIFGIDLTGVFWSPFVCSFVGYLLIGGEN